MAATTPFSRQLPLVLLLAWVPIDMLLTASVIFTRGVPVLLSPMVFFLIAQVGALAGWLILGSCHRLAHAAALLVLFVVSVVSTSHKPTEESYYLLCYLAVWCFPLVILRVLGWSFQRGEQPQEQRRMQVSLGELVGLTTLAAVVCGAWKALSVPENMFHTTLFESIGMVVLLALLTALWTLIGWARPRHSLCIAAGIGVITAKLAELADPVAPLAFRCALGGFVLFIAHVFALRAAGYTLLRRQIAVPC
jgi:hypothetical protein